MSGASRAWAALLSLPLRHPGAGERSTCGRGVSLGRIAQGQGPTGSLLPFKEATKGRKPLTQAESWRIGGTKQSD